jgi:hypothetical protein
MEWNYFERGGARVGKNYLISINYSFPLAKISVSNSQIELRMPFKRLLIPKSEISLKKYTGFFSKGIEIDHKSASLPEFLVFWSLKINRLIEALKKNGYAVED